MVGNNQHEVQKTYYHRATFCCRQDMSKLQCKLLVHYPDSYFILGKPWEYPSDIAQNYHTCSCLACQLCLQGLDCIKNAFLMNLMKCWGIKYDPETRQV